MSASGPGRDGPDGPERLAELSGTGSDLAGKIAPRTSPDESETRLRRSLQEVSHPAGMLVEQAARRFRVGDVLHDLFLVQW
jgi:hypothetical protein